MKLLVRLSANGRIGLGHAVRLGALLAEMRQAPELVVVGDGELWRPFMPPARHRQVADDDAGALADVVAEERPDAVLFDFPRHGPDLWRALRRCAGPVIAIDDEGGTVPADLVINGTILEEYHRYAGLPPNSHVLVGPRYTLLRKAFGATPWQGVSGRLVCVVGSGDVATRWACDLPRLLGGVRQEFTECMIVVGGAFPDPEGLRSLCDAAGIAMARNLSAVALAQALASAEMAIITGGMIVYEALAVGVPAIVYPQIPNLVPEARWFSNRGAVVDLGIDGGHDAMKLAEAVAEIRRPGRAGAMSAAGRAIVDGCGIVRAAEAVDAVLAGKAPPDMV